MNGNEGKNACRNWDAPTVPSQHSRTIAETVSFFLPPGFLPGIIP